MRDADSDRGGWSQHQVVKIGTEFATELPTDAGVVGVDAGIEEFCLHQYRRPFNFNDVDSTEVDWIVLRDVVEEIGCELQFTPAGFVRRNSPTAGFIAPEFIWRVGIGQFDHGVGILHANENKRTFAIPDLRTELLSEVA